MPRSASPRDAMRPDVVIVGGGIVGLAIAWRARQRGLSVIVVERGTPGAGASHVAAGMLAPVSEAEAGERELLVLALDSAHRWPGFARDLEAETGIAVGYRPTGSLIVARDRDDAEALDRDLLLRLQLGLRVERLPPSAARRLEPALAPRLTAALEAPDDHSVDPRAVCAALTAAAVRSGAAVYSHADASEVIVERGRVRGVRMARGECIAAERVVIAAGAWSGALRGIPRVPVRPVKGQILRLRDPSGPGLIERVIRWGPPTSGYLVPRADGGYVLGATMEDRGFDTTVTALAVHELLREAAELVPGVLELTVEEAIAGLRPGTPDNAPLLGESDAVEGLFFATGHHRNGVLLTPITAELLATQLAGERSQLPHSSNRFAGTPA